jgi:hypothetical protein
MDRTSFETLYLHANSLAELAFRRSVARVLLAPPPELTAEQLADNAVLAQKLMNPAEADFDWSALEGVEGFGVSMGEGDAAAALTPELPPEDAMAGLPTFSDAVDGLDVDLDDGPPDVARYLAQVDAARAQLEPRVADCFLRADHAAIAAALASLPIALAPITGALTPDEFTAWLELYEAGHEGLQAAVMEVRRLEPMF